MKIGIHQFKLDVFNLPEDGVQSSSFVIMPFGSCSLLTRRKAEISKEAVARRKGVILTPLNFVEMFLKPIE
jgi:hypothetical protein